MIHSDDIINKLAHQLKKTIHYMIDVKTSELNHYKKQFEQIMNIDKEYKFHSYDIDSDGNIVITYINILDNTKKTVLANNLVPENILKYEGTKAELNNIMNVFNIIAELSYYSKLLKYNELNKLLTNI